MSLYTTCLTLSALIVFVACSSESATAGISPEKALNALRLSAEHVRWPITPPDREPN